MGKLIDLTGQRFGRLTVISFAGWTTDRRAKWLCRCDCGKWHIVRGSHLRSGNVQSCGCYRKEVLVSCLRQRIEDADGHSKTRLYVIWQGMRMRCYNPSNGQYKRYGGRGIGICTDWNNWDNFYKWAIENGYSDDLTIDRIDVDGDYSPENCRWVDYTVQANNTTRNVRYTFDGENHTISEWVRLKGISQSALRSRLRSGWPVERALTEPVKRTKRK